MNFQNFAFNTKNKSFEEIQIFLSEHKDSITKTLNEHPSFFEMALMNAVKNKNINNLKALSSLNIFADMPYKNELFHDVIMTLSKHPDYHERYALLEDLGYVNPQKINNSGFCFPTELLNARQTTFLDFLVSRGLSKEFSFSSQNFLSYLWEHPDHNQERQLQDVRYILNNQYLLRLSQMQNGILYYVCHKQKQKETFLLTIDAFAEHLQQHNSLMLPNFLQLFLMKLYSDSAFNKDDIFLAKQKYPEMKFVNPDFLNNEFNLHVYSWLPSLTTSHGEKFTLLYQEIVQEKIKEDIASCLFRYLLENDAQHSDYDVFKHNNIDYLDFLKDNYSLFSDSFINGRYNSYSLIEPHNPFKQDIYSWTREFIASNKNKLSMPLTISMRKFISEFLINKENLQETFSGFIPEENYHSLFQIVFFLRDKKLMKQIFSCDDFEKSFDKQFLDAINNSRYNIDAKITNRHLDPNSEEYFLFQNIHRSLIFFENLKLIKYFDAESIYQGLETATENLTITFENSSELKQVWDVMKIKQEKDLLNNITVNSKSVNQNRL